ncbi:disease resistance protein Roq1-like [Carya illinoinensis]|uniref:disease resistance protein Roq1-like n=1 Tax=Carya illinoinensis TaxID=32201 RepID=UPI001C724E97|nr:disease resistance protein Roq1-like [Carya illinoinensis]
MKMQRWKEALTEVVGLFGFTLGDRYEPKIIQKIVQEVLRSINGKYLNVSKHPVGIEYRVRDVHNMLLSVGVNDTRILGIFGIGGVGKTSLAKAIYNSFIDQFEGSGFLANVRETSKQENGLIQLQETFLRKILGEKSLKVENIDDGINLIKETVCGKRVLLLLDDVDQLFQINNLLEECDWFGFGSIIFITTRDEHLLTSYNVHLRHKVKELNHDEAFRLFCWNAFKNEKPHNGFVQITKDVIRYNGGLPLALTVLGSYLHNRDIHHWKSALEKYKRIPHNDIQEKLRIGYDGLEENEKCIFLDIACFFTGEKEEYVTKILDGCGFFPNSGIKVLMDKSLIIIDESRKLVMHDLLKDTDREIGTNKIQGILIELPEQDFIKLSPEAFSEMKRLRIFINRNANFTRRPNYLSNELRLLDWHGYPSQSFPWNFHGNKLISLIMEESLIKELGNGMKNFQNLKTMKFVSCRFLTKIIDVLGLQSLEALQIERCENLVEIHQSVGFLDKLDNLKINNCQSLASFPRSLKLRYLKSLDLRFCKRLKKFAEIESEMKCLTIVLLAGTTI